MSHCESEECSRRSRGFCPGDTCACDCEPCAAVTAAHVSADIMAASTAMLDRLAESVGLPDGSIVAEPEPPKKTRKPRAKKVKPNEVSAEESARRRAEVDAVQAATLPARLDADGTAEPATRLLAHAVPDRDGFVQALTADTIEVVATGERTALAAPAPLTYAAFLERKSQMSEGDGFVPTVMPDFLFDFQRVLLDWAVRGGRRAIFADTGLGKTNLELAWAENVVRHTNRPVLLLTPLAVSSQTLREAARFGFEAAKAVDGITTPRIYVANYEKLHLLNWQDFGGLVCDESSIVKNASGETRKAITRFSLKLPYRLLCTATAAPNDYIELGTSSEVLGGLGHSEMLSRFFKQSDAKQSRIDDVKRSNEDRALRGVATGGNHFGKLSFRVSQSIGQWQMKGHAVEHFWRWVASWARAARKPSDLGPFDDARYVLPPLIERQHVVTPNRPANGMLFVQPAFGLQEERQERARTLAERCELAASLATHDRPAVVWADSNQEGDLLERLIPGAVQVAGKDSDEVKEERFEAFRTGQARVMVTKAKIASQGLNWQHCADVVGFASHSYEQYYQRTRRCYRYGQTRPVTVDTISTEGEVRVRDSMLRKAHAADAMFAQLISHMQDATRIRRTNDHTKEETLPPWL